MNKHKILGFTVCILILLTVLFSSLICLGVVNAQGGGGFWQAPSGMTVTVKVVENNRPQANAQLSLLQYAGYDQDVSTNASGIAVFGPSCQDKYMPTTDYLQAGTYTLFVYNQGVEVFRDGISVSQSENFTCNLDAFTLTAGISNGSPDFTVVIIGVSVAIAVGAIVSGLVIRRRIKKKK